MPPLPPDLTAAELLTLAVLKAASAAGLRLTADQLQAAVRELLEVAAETGLPIGYVAEAVGDVRRYA